MSHGVMVALQILVLPVQVRALVGQPISHQSLSGWWFFYLVFPVCEIQFFYGCKKVNGSFRPMRMDIRMARAITTAITWTLHDLFLTW